MTRAGLSLRRVNQFFEDPAIGDAMPGLALRIETGKLLLQRFQRRTIGAVT